MAEQNMLFHCSPILCVCCVSTRIVRLCVCVNMPQYTFSLALGGRPTARSAFEALHAHFFSFVSFILSVSMRKIKGALAMARLKWSEHCSHNKTGRTQPIWIYGLYPDIRMWLCNRYTDASPVEAETGAQHECEARNIGVKNERRH